MKPTHLDKPDIILAAWQRQVAQAKDKPWLAALLLRQGERLFHCFTWFYQQLRALPRKTRRVWQKKLGATLAGAALLLALAGPMALPAHAANITVDGTTCILADAITAANSDTATGGCSAGSGADTITLQTDVTLSGALPQITTPIVLEGDGHTIDGSSAVFHVLDVSFGGDLTLNNATITGGNANGSWPNNVGGGIYNDYGTVTLNNSTVSGNSVSANGGGIYNSGTVTLNNSTISGNTATFGGGGIHQAAGTTTLNNSTISDNYAFDGGGIFNFSSLTLNNSLVSGNRAGNYGAEIYNSDTVTADNFNLLGNNWQTDAQAFYGFSPCYGGPCTDIKATSDGNNTPLSWILDPILALNGGKSKTHSLVAGSPALDVILSGNCGGSTQDQRGLTRPINSNCDIGAFELQTSETSSYDTSFPTANIGGTNVSVTAVNSGFPLQINVLKRAGVYPGGAQTSGEFPIIWVLTATGSPFDVNLRLCYTAAELTSSGVTDENTIIAYRWDETTSSWVAQATTPDAANNCVNVNNVTGFSPWTLAGDGGSPTAVNLQGISASGSGGGLAALMGALSLALGSFWLRLRRKR